MRQIDKVTVALALLLLALAQGCGSREPAPDGSASQVRAGLSGAQLGFSFDANNYFLLDAEGRGRMLQQLINSGARMVRIEFNGFGQGGVFLPMQARREQYRDLICKLRAMKVETLLLLDYLSYDSRSRVLSDGTLDYNQDFPRFLEAVTHPGTGLIKYFREKAEVRHFEIWNEPNWGWRVGAQAMAEGLQRIQTYKNRNFPDVRIIAAAIESSKGNNTGGDNPVALSYMRELYSRIYDRQRPLLINGRPPFDALSIHPYHWTGADLTRNLQRVFLDVMARHGDSSTRLWITEIGSREEDDSLHWGEVQGILEQFRQGGLPRVDRLTFFTLYYFDRSSPGYHYGFLRGPGQPRLAYQEMRKLIGP